MNTTGMRLAAAAALALLAGSAAEARAQANLFEVEPYVGAFVHDITIHDEAFPGIPAGDDQTDVILGVRLNQRFQSGWGWGGSFGFVPVDGLELGPAFVVGDTDADVFLYNGEITYTFPTTGPVEVFVVGGIGGVTIEVDDIPGADDLSETNLLIPLGGGIKILDDPSRPTWAIRAEVRDHVVFLEDREGDDETDQSVEISVGFSFIF